MFNCHLYPRDIYYGLDTHLLGAYYVYYSFIRRPRKRGKDGLCFSLPTDLSELFGDSRYGLNCGVVAAKFVDDVEPSCFWRFDSTIRSMGKQDCVNIPKAFHRYFADDSEWLVFLVKSNLAEIDLHFMDYPKYRYRDIVGNDYEFGKWYIR